MPDWDEHGGFSLAGVVTAVALYQGSRQTGTRNHLVGRQRGEINGWQQTVRQANLRPCFQAATIFVEPGEKTRLFQGLYDDGGAAQSISKIKTAAIPTR
jgi:hypothetical protein